jgi:hypothetical protein
MLLRTLSCLWIIIFASAALAQERPPWSWTVEERLARRLNPRLLAERSRENARQLGDESADRPKFVIDGRENPELFLPTELMSFFLADADDANGQAARTAYGDQLAGFEWEAVPFWHHVDDAAADYYRLLKLDAQRRTSEIERELCARRFDALVAMRRQYPRFDEFLYTAVARRHTFVSNDVNPAGWLTWLDGGCR